MATVRVHLSNGKDSSLANIEAKKLKYVLAAEPFPHVRVWNPENEETHVFPWERIVSIQYTP